MEIIPHQNIFLILIAIAGVVALANLFVDRKLYYRTVPLFSPAEKNFYQALNASVSSDYLILGKVRIADVLLPSKNLSKKRWNRHFWDISSKHFDFVLCDKESLEVVCVIELNDKSHQKRSRAERDRLVDEVCTSANLPLVWFKAQRSYDQEAIQKTIATSFISEA